ncbi:putative Ig domain-containing protein [Candidatus Palauibacter sp.]|uniref:putative Ig domain-containing protein n=1 Tax=Candidatus Palauibacter sp. TaxID=3101350 RepID=UPI003B02BC93
MTDTIADLELAAGDSATFNLEEYFRDPDGDTLSYAPESSDERVAAVSVSGSTLTVRALAKGRATISVTVADRSGLSVGDSFDVTVPNRAPIVTNTIPTQRLTVGEASEWMGSEYFADPDGDALTYAAGTTDASIALAIVSGGDFGIVAVAPGTATVTVTATDGDGLSASQGFQVTVQAQGAVIITQVEPTVLLEGAPATIRGSGFSSIPGNNTVLIDGLAATVTAASSTSLSVTVPHADCLPPRQAELRVTASGSSAAVSVGVTPAREEDLALPAHWYRYTFSGNGCLHLPRSATGGEYLIGVVSTSEAPSSLTRVTMTSVPGDPTVAAEGRGGTTDLVAASMALAPAEPGATRMPRPAAPVGGVSSGLAQEALDPLRDRRRHDEIMERNRSLVRQLGRSDWPARTVDALADTVNYARGDTVTLYADLDRTCQQSGQVRAVVRLVGDNGIWLDDVANPSGTFTDAELTGFDAFLTRHTRPVHDSYFGRLSDVDANERLLILMTREVNRIDNLAGWVSWYDLYPASQCATSNEAEITYLYVPDPVGTVGEARTKQRLLDYYPLLLTHEITHLVQANAEVLGSADFKTSWEHEGGASLAEQLVAYQLFGHGSNRDLGYEEYRAGSYWYWNAWVFDMAAFFGWDGSGDGRGRIAGAPEQCTWIGLASEGNEGPCLGNPAYGVSSMVFRYAMDRWGSDYPGGEMALMRRLTQSPHRGFSSLEDVSGWRIEAILADFYSMLWADGRIYDANGMTSWNLYETFSRFDTSRHLLPWTSSHAAFEGSLNVRAGSSVYLHWTPRGGVAPTSLKVASVGGGRVPDHISVWALRIR